MTADMCTVHILYKAMRPAAAITVATCYYSTNYSLITPAWRRGICVTLVLHAAHVAGN